MSLELNLEEVNSEIQDLKDLKVKRSRTCFNKIYNHCASISKYLPPLSKKFKKVKNFYTRVEKVAKGKHHLPPEQIFRGWKRRLIKYFSYMKRNPEEFNNSLPI